MCAQSIEAMTRTDGQGRTVVQLAALSGNKEMFAAVLDACTEGLTQEQVGTVRCHPCIRSTTHISHVRLSRPNNTEPLVTHQTNAILMARDREEHTALTAAVKSKSEDTFRAVLCALTERMSNTQVILRVFCSTRTRNPSRAVSNRISRIRWIFRADVHGIRPASLRF